MCGDRIDVDTDRSDRPDGNRPLSDLSATTKEHGTWSQENTSRGARSETVSDVSRPTAVETGGSRTDLGFERG